MFVDKGNVSAHIPAYIKNSSSGRIDTHIADQNLRIRYEKTCCDKISGRRNISRYTNVLCIQFAARKDGCTGTAVAVYYRSDISAKRFQHSFRMISGKCRFRYFCFAVCIKSCQKYGRFYLSRRNGRKIVNSVKCSRINLKRGAPISFQALNRSSHL